MDTQVPAYATNTMNPPSMAIPPVTKNGFMLSGATFWVDIDGHPVERMPPDLLWNMLNDKQPAPLLTKAGYVAKRQSPPVDNNREDWWWKGQLKHYGLGWRKTGDTAKKRLLEAFGEQRGTLKVPEDVEITRRDIRESKAMKKHLEEQRRQDVTAAPPAVTSATKTTPKSKSTAAAAAARGKVALPKTTTKTPSATTSAAAKKTTATSAANTAPPPGNVGKRLLPRPSRLPPRRRPAPHRDHFKPHAVEAR
jgi:hypothetical protein